MSIICRVQLVGHYKEKTYRPGISKFHVESMNDGIYPLKGPKGEGGVCELRSVLKQKLR